MKISPVQYNNFDVGPFEMTTEVLPGETTEDAMTRAYAALEGFARKSYATKIESFRAAFQESTVAMTKRR